MEEEEEAIGFLDKVLEDEDVFLLEECELGTPTSPGSGSPFLVAVKVEAGKGLEMRKLVLSGFLASEEIYINQLEALLLPMKPLKATATTSQPVLTIQQIETIFYKIQDIYEIHKEFYDNLCPKVQQWDSQVTMGHLFQKLASQLGVYKAFVDNYKVALETAEKCSQSNNQFQKISEELKVKGPKDSKDSHTSVTMEALLYKPIDRVTRSTLVLHDLLKHTPVDHPDYPLLQDALRISQNFLSSINEDIDPRRTAVTTPKGETRQLVKDGFLVEMSESSRKLRHVFLFTDVLLCAKLKKTSAGKHQQYDCKWYIPLADLVFPSPEESEASPQVHPFPDHELEDMKTKISALKSEIQKEKANKGQSRAIERLKKKMFENEFLLLLNSPTIPFRIHNRNGKSYLFLLSSDYERSEWREAIQKLQKKDLQAFVLSSVELQVLTGSCFKLRTVHNIPVTSNKDDDESPGLYGFLHVIVHSAKGFKQSANLYCTLEVDSFGYFVSKAKTRVFRDTTEPKWDEEFEIELEGSQSLRILCYEKCYDKTKVNKDNNEIVDKIMGKGQIQGITLASSQAVSNARKLEWPLSKVAEGIFETEAPGGYKFYLQDRSPSQSDPVLKVTLAVSDLQKSLNYWSNLLGMKIYEQDEEKQRALLGYADNQCKLELQGIQGAVDHAAAFGRIAFSCPQKELPDLEDLMKRESHSILTPLVSLDTPGKATVQVVILADPDGHEICFVGDEAFRELSKMDPKGSKLLDDAMEADKSDEWFATRNKPKASG